MQNRDLIAREVAHLRGFFVDAMFVLRAVQLKSSSSRRAAAASSLARSVSGNRPFRGEPLAITGARKTLGYASETSGRLVQSRTILDRSPGTCPPALDQAGGPTLVSSPNPGKSWNFDSRAWSSSLQN